MRRRSGKRKDLKMWKRSKGREKQEEGDTREEEDVCEEDEMNEIVASVVSKHITL